MPADTHRNFLKPFADARAAFLSSLVMAVAFPAIGRAAAAEPKATVVTTGAKPCAMAVDGKLLYWLDRQGSIFRVPKAGGSSHRLVRGRTPLDVVCTLRLDDTHLYWSEGGKILRVRKSGGPAALLGKLDEDPDNTLPAAFDLDASSVYVVERDWVGVVRMPKEGGPGVALVTGNREKASTTPNQRVQEFIRIEGDRIYWTQDGQFYTVPIEGGACTQLQDTKDTPLASPDACVAGGYSFRIVDGEKLEQRSTRGRDDDQRVLDACPVSKTTLASDGHSVFWSEEPARYDDANIAKIVRLDLERTVRSMPVVRNEVVEAGDALRRWLRAAETGSIKLPEQGIILHLDFDIVSESRWSGSFHKVGRLSAVIDQLKKAGHGLFRFTHRCWDWRRLPANQQGRLPFPKSGVQTLKEGDVVIRSHQNIYGCPFLELTAVMRRFERDLIPVLLLYRSGYDCE